MQYMPYLQDILTFLSIGQEIRISDPVYLRHAVLALSVGYPEHSAGNQDQ
jgi:hypothetical protein